MTADGRIRCMCLPKNTTSLIQPMDQGVIYACKRFYRARFLNDVLVVDEDENDEEEDTRGKRTLENIESYNLRSAIFNWAAAWKDMKESTFSGAWKKLLEGTDADVDFSGFDAADFHHHLDREGVATA